jgi:hypothetical protein
VRTRLVFDLTLVLRSPFLFRDPGGALFGIDAAPLRDADGSPLIPADQLRGVLLEVLTDIAAVAPNVLSPAECQDLFGSPTQDVRASQPNVALSDPFAPIRAHILCSDLVGAASSASRSQSVRVQIDADTGAARPGFLQVVELVARPGAEVTFKGRLVVFARAGEEQKITTALERAWALLGPIGAQKSVGFGTVVAPSSSIKRVNSRALAIPTAAAVEPETKSFRMYFDRPFLVDARRAADNLFVGSEIVPGAVIKGALARRLVLGGEEPTKGRFAALLAATMVSHAWPENDGAEPTGLPLPLSLIAAKSGSQLLVADALGHGARGALLDGQSALYAPDWKPDWHGAVRARLGLPSLSDGDAITQVTRVHTKISGETGTADSGFLFTTVAVSHCRIDPTTGAATGEQRAWRLVLVPPADADPTDWAALLALLAEGLDGLGRTGASVRFEAAAPPLAESKIIADSAGRIAIMLTTPAVLCDAKKGESAKDAYAAYWASVLPRSTLVDHVAQQRLAGGYAAQRHRAYSKGYVPFILTEPGAVFLLDGVEPCELLELMRTGLPVPPLGGTVPSWETCPFVSQNGYGAFVADHFDRIAHLSGASYV